MLNKNHLTLKACIVLSVLALTISCKKNSVNQQLASESAGKDIAQTSAANTLAFKNRFQGTTSVITVSPTWKDDIIGNDGSSYPSDWTQYLETVNPYFSDVMINYEQGNSAQRKAEIIADPTPNAPAGNKVLRFKIVEPHIVIDGTGEIKGRIQIELNNKKAMPAGGYVKEYRQKVRLYLHPDFQYLVNSSFPSGPEWLNLFEFWNDPTWQAGENEARIGVNLNKNTPGLSGDKLRFQVNNEMMKPTRTNLWSVKNTTYEVPLGKWMTIEIYIKEGDANTGKFQLFCTVDGVRTTVIDKTGVTKHPNHSGDGMTAWNPMKLYCAGNVVNRFKNNGAAMQVYWDDLEIYTN